MIAKYAKRLGVGAVVAALAIGVGVVVAVPGSAKAAEVEGPKVNWLLSTWGKRRGMTEGIEELAKRVSDATAGNFTISIQYGATLSDPKENLDGLKIGAFEAAMFCPMYHPGKVPAMTGLDLAFLPIFDSASRAKIHEVFFKHPVIAKEFDDWNAVPLISALMPGYEVMGRGKPPLKVADWKGLRLHAGGGMGAVMRALGATTMTLPAPETYQSLERGMIDGLAFPFTYAFAAYRLHEVSNWYTENLALGSTSCPVATNKDAYNALPQQYKDLLEAAKWPAYEHQRKAFAKIDEKNLAAFKKAGLTAVRYPDDVREELVEKVARPSWDAWAAAREAEGLPGKELLDFLLLQAAKTTAGN